MKISRIIQKNPANPRKYMKIIFLLAITDLYNFKINHIFMDYDYFHVLYHYYEDFALNNIKNHV